MTFQRILILVYLFCLNDLQAGLSTLLKQPVVQDHIGSTLSNQAPPTKLAVALIFQNDALYLKEWIEYYRMLGVTRFYMYNNLSEDNYKKVLAPYVKSGDVILIKWKKEGIDLPSWNGVQCTAYMDALYKARRDRVEWLAIIDSDEFIVPRHTDSLVDFLADYENETIGSLTVNWVMFGTSYVEKIPANHLLIETLTLNKGYVLCGGKVIVRPDRCAPSIMGGPHSQPLLPGYQHVDLPMDFIQCNHYWSRDEYYLKEVKIPRRLLWGTPPEICAQWESAHNEQTPASIPILRFVPELRKRMGFD